MEPTQNNPQINLTLIEQVLALLPPQVASDLLDLAMAEELTPEQLEMAAATALEQIDWQGQQEQVGHLINQLMPLEKLVPDIYAEWRPVVRDAVAFIGSHLSPRRLAPKLVEQMLLPDDLPLEQRLILLIAQMPSLQKIGQIVARNRNLEPAFRAELTRLENAIQDVTPAQVQAELERQLGAALDAYQVELEPALLAEASVSATMRFTWLDPATGRPEPGVFKVLKPYINDYFSEELDLLQGLADFFESRRGNYPLSQVNLGDLFNDVRRLLEQEINFPNEQANLVAAYQRYANFAGIRTPRLLPELSTSTITALTAEDGVKVTEAFPQDRLGQIEVAARLVEALVAIPLFAPEEDAMFHADPHAGNLFVDERTGELILFDWALTERLSREARRQIILLVLAVALRDERYIFKTIDRLCQDDLSRDRAKASLVRRHVARFIRQLSPFTLPGVSHVLSLLDQIILSGVAVSGSLLMFRKVLFTLDGVLHDVVPGLPLDPFLAWYIIKQRANAVSWLKLFGTSPAYFRSPLSHFDQIALAWSAQFFGLRAGLQTGQHMTTIGLRTMRRLLFGVRNTAQKLPG